MKLAVAVAGVGAPDSAFVVWRGFETSLEKAATYGYDGVELALKDAEEIDLPTFRKHLDAHGLEVSCISTGQVFAVSGLSFTHPDPGLRRRTVEVFEGLVDLAAELASGSGGLINVGRARGSYCQEQSAEETEGLFIETARKICDYAAPKNVTLMIEPVNRYEINFINSVPQAAEILSRVGRENIGIMPDVFHMNIEDATIGGTLAEYAEQIPYVHLADSNRYYPGAGHLDFADVFGALQRSRYDGWVSVEILPFPDPDTAAEKAVANLRPLVDRYNDTRALQEAPNARSQ
jgi:5-keto-L-gluconate epimerase